RRALGLVRDGVRLPALPRALGASAAGDMPSLSDYLELDDQVLLVAIHEWESASCPILSELCRRLRARALFKTIEIFKGPDGAPSIPPEEALARAKEIALGAGLDPEIYVGLDVATDTPYADDASLKVMFPRGRSRLPSE